MRFLISLSIGIVLCATSTSFSQSISWNWSPGSYLCYGSTIKVNVTTTGNFEANNQFAIRVRYSANGQDRTKDFPAQLSNGTIEFRLNDPDLLDRSYVQAKVVSSAPVVESGWSYSFALTRAGDITISSSADTLNAYDNASLLFTVTSPGPTRVTLSNGQEYSFSAYQSNYQYRTEIAVGSTATYTVASASNECGSLSPKGQARFVVNPISIQPRLISTNGICFGTEFKVGVTALNQALPANAKYRVRILKMENGGPQKQSFIEAPATLSDGILTAKLDVSSYKSGESYYGYYLQVLADNPAIVSSVTDKSFSLYPVGSVQFTSQSQSISFGSSYYMSFDLKGVAPFLVELSDGSGSGAMYSGSSNINLYPNKTTSYSIKSLETGCGGAGLVSNQNVLVTVQPGILIDVNTNTTLCEGTLARIPVKHNLTVTSDTKLWLVGTFSNGAVTRMEGKLVDGNILEVNIPKVTGLQDAYGFRVETSSPSVTGALNYSIRIGTTPSFTSVGGSAELDTPGEVYLHVNLSGNPPYRFKTPNGWVTSTYNSVSLNPYIKSTGFYMLTDLSNGCSSSTGTYSVYFSVKNTNSTAKLALLTKEVSVCQGDSVQVEFDSYGTFGGNNSFQIQAYLPNGQYQTIKTVAAAGKYWVKFPSEAVNYTSLRVSSNNPVLFTGNARVWLNRPVESVKLNTNSSLANPISISSGNSGYLSGTFVGYGPATMVYNDGTKDVEYSIGEGNSFSVYVNPDEGKVTKYTIKSITNSCGTRPLDVEAYFYKNPYEIRLNYGNSTFCKGEPFSYYFTVYDFKNGVAGNTEFTLQLAPEGGSTYIDLVKTKSMSRFEGKIPANLAKGNYSLRVVSSDGVVSSSSYSVRIMELPTAVLSTTAPMINGEVSIDAGSSLEFKATVTGSGPMTVSLNDERLSQLYSEGTHSLYAYPTKGQVYKIQRVGNECGFGKSSGEVKVVVKPTLRINLSQYSICEGNSLPVSFQVLGDAALTSVDYLVFQLWNVTTQKGTPIDSTLLRSGSLMLKIPSPLQAGNYSIRAILRKYSIVSQLNVNVSTKAVLSIFGSTTINSGDLVRLRIRSEGASNEYIRYTLSSGVSGEIYGGRGSTTEVQVYPQSTTTYTLTSATNSCGAGTVSGQAVVTVNPVSERSISTTQVYYGTKYFCTGDTIRVEFSTKGTFSGGNTFSVQLSDENGANFSSIPTLGNTSPLRAVLPASMKDGAFYRLRVAASDAGTSSGAWSSGITGAKAATARFESESVYFQGQAQVAKAVVVLDGTGPWSYTYGTDLVWQNKNASVSPDTLYLRQASPSMYYRIFSVVSNCGPGTVITPSTLKVELVTAVEPNATEQIKIGPNPATTHLDLYFANAAKRKLFLVDIQGRTLYGKETTRDREQVDTSRLPVGVYFLRVESGKQKLVYKVIKE